MCTIVLKMRERNHHKMTQDQIKRRVELLWLMHAQKRAMGASACETVCIARTHTRWHAHSHFHVRWYDSTLRTKEGSREFIESWRERKRKKIKGDDICYINISRSFDRIILHLPRLSCFISVLSNFGDLKYLIRNAPILICVFVCARIIPYLPVEKKVLCSGIYCVCAYPISLW